MPIKQQAFCHKVARSRSRSKSLTFITLLLTTLVYSNPLQACVYEDKRICSMDSLLRSETNGHVVSYSEIKNESKVASSGTEWVIGAPDIIHLSDTTVYSDDELLFLMAHEFNHSFDKHMRKQLENVSSYADTLLSDVALFRKNGHLMDKASTALNHRLEFESDAFAVRLLFKLGKDPVSVMRNIPIIPVDTHSHPSKRSRIERAQKMLMYLQGDQ